MHIQINTDSNKVTQTSRKHTSLNSVCFGDGYSLANRTTSEFFPNVICFNNDTSAPACLIGWVL
jgi:hypothetical protein